MLRDNVHNARSYYDNGIITILHDNRYGRKQLTVQLTRVQLQKISAIK